MKFNSQICTTREQSERLLALGLKKETSDMGLVKFLEGDGYTMAITEDYSFIDIPSWSLHRLIEMMPKSIYHKNLACFLIIDQSVYVEYRHILFGASQTIVEQFMKSNLWDNIICCIEWLIKEGYFNKKYLVDQEALEERCKGVLEYLDYIRGEEE